MPELAADAGRHSAVLAPPPAVRPVAPSSTQGTAPTLPHLPALDGVRGLAIVLVLAVHYVTMIATDPPTTRVGRVVAAVAGYGWSGVDLFFVLSGFLITATLLATRDGPHYARNFYVRRLLRIAPLYYALLAGLLVVLPLVTDRSAGTIELLRELQAWYWTYLPNVYMALAGTLTVPLPFLWSLAVEEQFYLVWPWVVRWARRDRVFVAIAAAGIVGALAFRW